VIIIQRKAGVEKEMTISPGVQTCEADHRYAAEGNGAGEGERIALGIEWAQRRHAER
jgi:hypothetical protein